jgi:hypothetical protein
MRDKVEAIEAIRGEQGLFGFGEEVLLPYLSFEEAKPFLRDGITREEWQESIPEGPAPWSEEHVIGEMRTYMAEYGWPKCLGHRGISAGRTVEKMSAWVTLLGGHDDLLRFLRNGRNYAQYGAPMLVRVCEEFGFPIPDDPEAKRMAAGEPCTPDCEDGCGR